MRLSVNFKNSYLLIKSSDHFILGAVRKLIVCPTRCEILGSLTYTVAMISIYKQRYPFSFHYHCNPVNKSLLKKILFPRQIAQLFCTWFHLKAHYLFYVLKKFRIFKSYHLVFINFNVKVPRQSSTEHVTCHSKTIDRPLTLSTTTAPPF